MPRSSLQPQVLRELQRRIVLMRRWRGREFRQKRKMSLRLPSAELPSQELDLVGVSRDNVRC